MKKNAYKILLIFFLSCKPEVKEIKIIKNYVEAIEVSREFNKPILICFNSYVSGGTDEFKGHLLTSKKILKKLEKQFVTVELFVDDPNEIEQKDTLNIHYLNFSKKGKEMFKKAKSIGEINRIIENDMLKLNSQPQYLIIDKNENILIKPYGYSKNKKRFISNLNRSLKKIKKKR